MYLASVQKSISFGEEVNNRVRYIVVCAYRNGGSSRLSRGRLGNQTDYVLSVDLESIYPPTKPTGEEWENYEPSDFWSIDRRTKETVFDAEKALSDFMSTFGGLEDDTLKGVDVPISEIDDDGTEVYEVAATGNEKRAYHFAVDVNEPYEATKQAAKRALEKHIENGTLIPLEPKAQSRTLLIHSPSHTEGCVFAFDTYALTPRRFT